MAIPIPNLTLAAPSTATSSSPFAPNFAVGKGVSAGGISPLIWLGGAALFLVYLLKHKRA